ncbi:MAG: type II toxin-antitoxin system prevent-host-death family antitoxin [Propionibacteriaceae bacterium]|jgi:prevent-host-death family protein|nr:type II toxin-antitoxin system prevent-host-death family antitoxin [Propionibacteriaceae bacterium]
MTAVGILDAKNQFSRLVALAENGYETVLTRHGRPVARIAPPPGVSPVVRTLGLWKDYTIPDGWDAYTPDDDRLWYGDETVADDTPAGATS